MCDPERFKNLRPDHGGLYEDSSFYTTVRPSPPPPLPGVFVVDPPKHQINVSQIKSNLIQQSKTLNTTYGHRTKIPTFSGYNNRTINPNQNEFRSSLDIFDYPLSDGHKDFNALQPLIQNTDDAMLPAEENVYHTLQPVPHNVFDIPSSSEPKIYQQLQPVQNNDFCVSLQKSDEPESYQLVGAAQIDRNLLQRGDITTYEDFRPACQSVTQQTDTKSIQQLNTTSPLYDPPHYASSKLYQQLRQPLNKPSRMKYQTGEMTLNNLGQVTINNFEQPQHSYHNQDQHIQTNDHMMFASLDRSNSFSHLQRLDKSKNRQDIQQSFGSRMSLSNQHESSKINGPKHLSNLKNINISPDKGFQSNKPKVYLELRNPSIRHHAQATQRSYQNPSVGIQHSNTGLGSNRSHEKTNFHQSFEKIECKPKQLRLPGPYEFKLSQNESESYKLPKILCPEEYTTSTQLREQKGFSRNIKRGDIQSSIPSSTVKSCFKNVPSKHSLSPVKPSISLLSLPKTPVCYGDSNVSAGNEHITYSFDCNKTNSIPTSLNQVSPEQLSTSTFSHNEFSSINQLNNVPSISDTRTKLQELLMATNLIDKKATSSTRKQDLSISKPSEFEIKQVSDNFSEPVIRSNYSTTNVQNNLLQNDGCFNRIGDANERVFKSNINSKQNSSPNNKQRSDLQNPLMNSLESTVGEISVNNETLNEKSNYSTHSVQNNNSRSDKYKPQTNATGQCKEFSSNTSEYCKINLNKCNEMTNNSSTSAKVPNNDQNNIREENYQYNGNNINLTLHEKQNYSPTNVQNCASNNKESSEGNSMNINYSNSDILTMRFNETESNKNNVFFTNVQHCTSHNQNNFEKTTEKGSNDGNNKIKNTSKKVTVQSNSSLIDDGISLNGVYDNGCDKITAGADFKNDKIKDSSDPTNYNNYSHQNKSLIKTQSDKSACQIQNYNDSNQFEGEEKAANLDCRTNYSLSTNQSNFIIQLSGINGSNKKAICNNYDKINSDDSGIALDCSENNHSPIQLHNERNVIKNKPSHDEDQPVSVPPVRLRVTPKSESLVRKYKKRRYTTNFTESCDSYELPADNLILNVKEKNQYTTEVPKSNEVNITLTPSSITETNLGRKRSVKKVDYKILNGGEEEGEEDIIKVKKRKYNKSVKRINHYKIKEVKSSGLLITNTAAISSKTPCNVTQNKNLPMWRDEETGIRKKRKYTKRTVNTNRVQETKFDKQEEESSKTSENIKKEDDTRVSPEISSSVKPASAKVKEEFVDPLEEGLISDNEDEVVFLGFDMPSEDDETILGFDFSPTKEVLDPVHSLCGQLEVDFVTVDCDPRSLMQPPLTNCPQCAKSFSSHQDLVNHMQWHSAIQSPHSHSYVCSVCFRGFPSQNKLEKHIKWNHEGGKRFNCPICPKRFTTKAYAKRHAETMHKEEKSEVNITSSEYTDSFPTEDLLKVHENEVERKNLHQCEICLKSFEKFPNLQRHMVSHSNADQAFPCVDCNQTFSSKELLHSHLSVHQDKKMFKCETCDIEFTAANSLKRHKLLHAKEKLFRCEICQRSFSLLSTLKTHLLIHTGARRYECRICHKTFNRRDVLNAHQWVHTGEKKFQCEICKKMFRWRHAVKSHKLIYHSTTKPFVCKICGKKFSHPDSFKKHAQVHSDKLYLCQICLKAFSRPNTLKTHIITHTDHKPFFCDVCHKGFRSKSHLKSHFLVHTKNKPWFCKFCKKTYKDHNQLRRHKRLVHCKAFYKKVLGNVTENVQNSEIIAESNNSANNILVPEKNSHLLEITHKGGNNLPEEYNFVDENILLQSSEHFLSLVNLPSSE